ncbi:MAG: dockerin type I domain-containing protein, partial [Planctomycetota bacterium]
MKNLRQLARRSGLLSNGKRRRRNDSSQRSGSGGRSLRTETLEKRQLLAGDAFAPEHNYWNAYDVNDDGQITARDALAVINRVSSGISSAEAEQSDSDSSDQMFPDVNADFAVTALDALTVINAVSRGEETGELVELQLRALSDPTDGTSTISQIGVNEVFHLEVSYNDLRQNSLGNVVRIGAFQVFTDLVTDQAGVLSPVLNETQVLVIDNSVLS